MNKLLGGGCARRLITHGKNILRYAEKTGSAFRRPVILMRPFHSSNAVFSQYFTKEHEWINMDDEGVGTVGITKYAQDQLGDIVYCELPEVGSEFAQGDSMAVIESVKAASDLFAPVSGEITEINEKATEDPSLITNSPTEEGWLVKIKLSSLNELEALMSAEKYDKFTEE